MAIPIIKESFVTAPITKQKLYDGIKVAFANCGYPLPFDEYTSGTESIVVYEIIFDANKTYGRTYLRIRVFDNLVVYQTLWSSWNKVSHTGANGSPEPGYSGLVSNVQISFMSFQGDPEYKLPFLYQGGTSWILGYLAPVNRPEWWDLDAWCWCFILAQNNFNVMYSSLNPYNNGTYDCNLGTTRMAHSNLYTNRRDILPGILIFNQSNYGVSGRTSDDFVMVAANGANRFDRLQIPNSPIEYLILTPGNGGVALRTV